jgi:exosortase/archaeosortase family protein
MGRRSHESRRSRHDTGAPHGRVDGGEARRSSLPLRAILLFGLFLIAGTYGITLPWLDRTVITPWTEANAAAAAAVSTALGQRAYAYDTSLITAGGKLVVKKGCNGVEAFVILVSAILASPVAVLRRLAGVLLAAVGIFGCNILRLVNLLFVAVHDPQRLDLFHIYIWQTLIVLMAFGIFMLWGTFLAGRR